MKLNNVDELYNSGLIVTDDGWKCPVCEKNYKINGFAQKHLDKRDCFTMVHLFRDTDLEPSIRTIANHLVAQYIGARAFRSMKSFRKSRYYNPVAKIMLYNILNGVNDIEKYIMWGMDHCGNGEFWHLTKFLGRDILSLTDYYRYKIRNITIEEQEKFYHKMKYELHTNSIFLIRSLEKGDITLLFLAEKMDIGKFVDSISEIQRQRLLEICRA